MGLTAVNLAAWRTSELIPLCHPLPLERIEVSCHFDETTATVRVGV